jgi:hypothetical protein
MPPKATAKQKDAARKGLAIADRLAKADPGNASRQRDLSVSYGLVGNVLVAQGNLTEALQSYRDSLAINERLAKAAPAMTSGSTMSQSPTGRSAI